MKYVLVIYEGAADAASDELEGSTPLQLARNVHATSLMRRGMAGYLAWPDDAPLDRLEQTLATVMGIPVDEARMLHRGPVEAAGVADSASRWEYAYRGNYVTTDGRVIRESRVSGLTLDETSWLTDAVAAKTGASGITLSVTGTGRVAVRLNTPPGDADVGNFPEPGMHLMTADEDAGEGLVRETFMREATNVLTGHSINEVRVDLGENPADILWLWGGGTPAVISRPFIGAPLKAAMVTNSPLGRGMAALCRMKCRELGDLWADRVKPDVMAGEALATVIAENELTVIYVEAPEELGRYGTPVEKVKALDRMDIHVLGRVAEVMEQNPDIRLMLVALPEENQQLDKTPILVAGAKVAADRVERWDETAALNGSVGKLAAPRCMTRLLGD